MGDAAVRTKESQDGRRCYSYCNGQQSQSASQDSFMDKNHLWELTDHRIPWTTMIPVELHNLLAEEGIDFCHNNVFITHNPFSYQT